MTAKAAMAEISFHGKRYNDAMNHLKEVEVLNDESLKDSPKPENEDYFVTGKIFETWLALEEGKSGKSNALKNILKCLQQLMFHQPNKETASISREKIHGSNLNYPEILTAFDNVDLPVHILLFLNTLSLKRNWKILTALSNNNSCNHKKKEQVHDWRLFKNSVLIRCHARRVFSSQFSTFLDEKFEDLQNKHDKLFNICNPPLIRNSNHEAEVDKQLTGSVKQVNLEKSVKTLICGNDDEISINEEGNFMITNKNSHLLSNDENVENYQGPVETNKNSLLDDKILRQKNGLIHDAKNSREFDFTKKIARETWIDNFGCKRSIGLKDLEKMVEDTTSTKRNASENQTGSVNSLSGVTLLKSCPSDAKILAEEEVMKNIWKFPSGVEARSSTNRTFFQNVSSPFIGSGFGSTVQTLNSYLAPSNQNKSDAGFGTSGFGYFESLNSGDDELALDQPKITASKNLAKKTKKKSTKKRYMI